MWEDLNEDGHPVSIWFDWPQQESEAAELVTWQHTIVPGLLQTPAYAHAFLSSDEAVEARMARQIILTRTDAPPTALTALLSDGVLTHLVGSPEVMREQIEHLVSLSLDPPGDCCSGCGNDKRDAPWPAMMGLSRVQQRRSNEASRK
ncbi:DUF5753 domain-containing protein, partial [Spirillospora sp. NPDC048832]